jgi:hypothetical protein
MRLGCLVTNTITAADRPVYCGTERWRSLVAKASSQFGITHAWLYAVIRAESAGCEAIYGRPITSTAGAMGLMRHEFLVDRAGAPGMSGSPVFLEGKSGLRLIGMYTGVVRSSSTEGITLGTCADLRLCWEDHLLPLVPVDSPNAKLLDAEGRLMQRSED